MADYIPPDIDRWLTLKSAGEQWGVSAKRVYKWIKGRGGWSRGKRTRADGSIEYLRDKTDNPRKRLFGADQKGENADYVYYKGEYRVRPGLPRPPPIYEPVIRPAGIGAGQRRSARTYEAQVEAEQFQNRFTDPADVSIYPSVEPAERPEQYRKKKAEKILTDAEKLAAGGEKKPRAPKAPKAAPVVVAEDAQTDAEKMVPVAQVIPAQPEGSVVTRKQGQKAPPPTPKPPPPAPAPAPAPEPAGEMNVEQAFGEAQKVFRIAKELTAGNRRIPISKFSDKDFVELAIDTFGTPEEASNGLFDRIIERALEPGSQMPLPWVRDATARDLVDAAFLELIQSIATQNGLSGTGVFSGFGLF